MESLELDGYLEASTDAKGTNESSGHNTGTIETHFSVNHQWMLVETRNSMWTDGRLVRKTKAVGGVNSKYAFILKGNADGSAYTLASLTSPPTEEFLVEVLSTPRYIRASWTLFNIPLFRVFQDAGTTLREVNAVNIDNKEYVSVVFDYAPRCKKGLFDPFRGIIMLDPENHWCIKEYTITFSEAARCVGRMPTVFPHSVSATSK